MDNEQARFILSACQPSGADANNPEIARALAQAGRDPELAAWLERERRSDEAIARLMQQTEPPPGLRARLLAGGRMSRRKRRWRRFVVPLSLAAGLALSAGAVWWGLSFARHTTVTADAGSLLAWQQSSVAIFADPFFHLDVENAVYPPLEAHLRTQGAPVVDAVPFGDGVTAAVGCKLLRWSGANVSLSCFRADTGELVHIFVIPRGHFDEAPLQESPHRAQVGNYATVTWLQNDRVVMVASKLSAPELERMFAPGVTFAALTATWSRAQG